MAKKKTTHALEILDSLVGTDVDLREQIREATLNARIAQMIYKARKAKKLTQAQLAEKVNTTQSVIARLEDAEYEGHSLEMLQRIAKALGLTLEVNFREEQLR